jgi:alpha-N-arabinofuranosidase
MYGAHQGAQAVRAMISAPQVTYSRNGQPATLPGLAGSASLNGKRVIVTVTNQSLDQTRQAEVVVRGATIQSVAATTLAAADVHAHNTFESPRAVEPKEEAVPARGNTLTHRFAPASVTKLEITLA